MEQLVSTITSTGLQVGAAFLIALAVWALFGRKSMSFWRYAGLTPTTWLAVSAATAMAILVAGIVLFTPGVRDIAGGENSVVAETAAGGLTPSVAAALAISALLQTSLSEELLFRGVIGKRLIAWLGFAWGNLIQAAIFGAIHFALFLIPGGNPAVAGLMILIAAAGGWADGWLNEKLGRGSILPGWIAHGLANLISYFVFAAQIS